ncbi:hypothetical protein ATY76_31695 [Rhizobium sp. R339]|nr:hypothetical protein ATY76_31695 [Rhizobium sp. R339]
MIELARGQPYVFRAKGLGKVQRDEYAGVIDHRREIDIGAACDRFGTRRAGAARRYSRVEASAVASALDWVIASSRPPQAKTTPAYAAQLHRRAEQNRLLASCANLVYLGASAVRSSVSDFSRSVTAIERVCRQVGYPASIRVDNCSEFLSRDLDLWAYHKDVVLNFSRPGKPTDNSYIQSFKGKFRAECLNSDWFMIARHTFKHRVFGCLLDG